MENNLNKNISLIGVPFDMGASLRGTRLGPEAIRLAGVIERLDAIGCEVEDHGDLQVINNNRTIEYPKNINNLRPVKSACEKLCAVVSEEIKRERLPLILGGDHSIVLGSGKGVLENFKNPGIIYIDAHADINTDKTSPSGNIHGMPIAALMGYGNEKLVNIGCSENKLKPENIVYIGLRDVDMGEKIFLKEHNIKAFSMQDIDRVGIEAVMNAAIEYIEKTADHIHLSFDVDSLDPAFAPGTGVKVNGGLNFREAKIALELISQIDNICSVEFVEVNPLLDDGNKTAELTTDLILSLFGEMQL
jgi:arginase